MTTLLTRNDKGDGPAASPDLPRLPAPPAESRMRESEA